MIRGVYKDWKEQDAAMRDRAKGFMQLPDATGNGAQGVTITAAEDVTEDNDEVPGVLLCALFFS